MNAFDRNILGLQNFTKFLQFSLKYGTAQREVINLLIGREEEDIQSGYTPRESDVKMALRGFDMEEDAFQSTDAETDYCNVVQSIKNVSHNSTD